MNSRRYQFEHWGNELPTLSCLCPTYGRPHLIGEAIESFLRQDYPGKKELIVLNDHSGTRLTLPDQPNVKIINTARRYHSLGEKRNTLAALATGQILVPWDDDDISLPWRLSVTIEAMHNHHFVKPTNILKWNGKHAEHKRGNIPHGTCAYSREAFVEVGGYEPMQTLSGEAFESAIARIGLYDAREFSYDNLFYLYRTVGVNSYHLSHHHPERGWDACRTHVTAKVESSTVQIQPKWNHDYTELLPVANSTKPTFLIAICSAQNYQERRQACRETWISRLPGHCRYFFFVGRGCNTQGEADVIEVDSDDSYSALSAKTKAMLAYTAQMDDFDYLLKCDDDSYIVGERLHEIVNPSTDLTGFVWNNQWKSLSGGAGYVIARKHLLALSAEVNPKATYEDVEVTLAARRLGFLVEGTPRLQCGHGQIPSIHNDRVSSHWCDPDFLRKIHQDYFRALPAKKRQVMGNFYLIHEGSQWAAVCISKNACTSLKQLVLAGAEIHIENKNALHDRIGYSSDSPFLKTVSAGKPPGYTCFAVWRDPVDRFTSVFKHFALDGVQQGRLAHLPSDDFDAWINHAEVELALPHDEQDEHFRPQANYFTLNAVDLIVKSTDLNRWFSTRNWALPERENQSHTNFKATPSQARRIRELYQMDLSLFDSAKKSGLIWHPG